MSDQSEAFPVLTSAQLARLRSYGTPEEVAVGDVVSATGRAEQDLLLIDQGAVEVVRSATFDAPEEVVVRHTAGRFVGELNLLTGQRVAVVYRVVEPGRLHRIAPDRFRRLMAEDPELSDVLLRAFLARRDLLRDGGAARAIEIVGSERSAASLELRTYAARQRLAHLWIDTESVAGQVLMRAVPLVAADLPAVLTPAGVLRRATAGDLAEHLGLTYRSSPGEVVDLAVIGAGPAGLAAAVYGASEGLSTVLLDAVGIGGQAAASARIENYLGFPSGVSGAELTGSAAVQAEKFGARLYSPCHVVGLETGARHLELRLDDGTAIPTRAVVIATGVRYRALPLERWSELEGSGIFYAATELEARGCAGGPVVVIGGANSAGQAALFLASRGSRVTLVVRGADLLAGMSSYLAERLVADPAVTVRTGCEVTRLEGGARLEAVTLTDHRDGASETQACAGLFCFIGAVPATSWLAGVATDDDGYVLTDAHLDASALPAAWSALGRGPLPFETSLPGVFAAGDVRRGSMKRVAAAVGEGASAVHSVHAAIGAVR